MARAAANGIVLDYVEDGPADGEPLLLIHGVGAQLVRWPAALVERLAGRGFRVIRFDSRDVGLSTHMDDAPVPDLAAAMAARARGQEPDLPYTLSDLAADAVGLLDALGIARAHLFGVSLGGMVAQVIAIDQPHRVRSLALAMTQAGNPDLAAAASPALGVLAARPPDPAVDREGYLAHSVALNRALGSPDYPTDEAELRAMAAQAADRRHDPAGAARQLVAGRAAADRRAMLRALRVPTLVIHGVDDPLTPVAAGRDLAEQVRGAWLLAVNGMGHDLPPSLADLFVGAIAANAARPAPGA